MTKRNTQQRRRAIIDMLDSQGEVRVDALAAHFATSDVTIRKDLSALESNGLLLRRYGGAVPMPQALIADPAAENVSPHNQASTNAAAQLIRDHSRICLDNGGTTTANLLPELSHRQGLVVMTNSLGGAYAL